MKIELSFKWIAFIFCLASFATTQIWQGEFYENLALGLKNEGSFFDYLLFVKYASPELYLLGIQKFLLLLGILFLTKEVFNRRGAMDEINVVALSFVALATLSVTELGHGLLGILSTVVMLMGQPLLAGVIATNCAPEYLIILLVVAYLALRPAQVFAYLIGALICYSPKFSLVASTKFSLDLINFQEVIFSAPNIFNFNVAFAILQVGVIVALNGELKNKKEGILTLILLILGLIHRGFLPLANFMLALQIASMKFNKQSNIFIGMEKLSELLRKVETAPFAFLISCITLINIKSIITDPYLEIQLPRVIIDKIVDDKNHYLVDVDSIGYGYAKFRFELLENNRIQTFRSINPAILINNNLYNKAGDNLQPTMVLARKNTYLYYLMSVNSNWKSCFNSSYWEAYCSGK